MGKKAKLMKKQREAQAQRGAMVPSASRYWGMTGGLGIDAGEYAAALVDRGQTIPRNDYGLAVAFLVSVWAYRATSVRARMVGRTPWEIRRRGTDEVVASSKDSNPRHPLARALHRVRIEQGANLFELWEYSLCIWGETYIEKVKNQFDFPAGLWWMNPVDVNVVEIGGEIESLTYTGYMNRVSTLHRDDFVLARLFSPLDPTRGTSPMELALQSINIDSSAQAFIRQNYRNFAYIPMIIRPKDNDSNWSQSEVSQLADDIAQKWAGMQNVGRAQVIGQSVDIDTITPPKLDDQLHTSDSLITNTLAAFGVPRPLVGDTDSTRYKSNDDVVEWFYTTTLGPQLDMGEETVNLTLMPFFDPDGDCYFTFVREAYEFVTDATLARQSLMEKRLNTTAMTLYDYQVSQGVKEPEDFTKNLWKVEGVTGFVPTSELPALWKTLLPTPYAPMVIDPAPTPTLPPVVPPPSAPLPPTEPERSGRVLCAALNLANHPDLIDLQARIKQMVGDAPAEWNAPDSFHVTLAYAPSVAPELFDAAVKAIEDIPVPDLSLRIGSLEAFDSVGRYALHFRIRRNTALLDYQAEVVDALRDIGVTLSSYSEPAQYKPHVTMCYADDKTRATFDSRLTVKPLGVIVWDEDENAVYRSDVSMDEVEAEAVEVSEADQRALTEFEAFATFVRKGSHATRSFAWAAMDADTAYLIEHDLTSTTGTERGAAIEQWRRVMSVRAGILPEKLIAKHLPDATRAYAQHIEEVYRPYFNHLRETHNPNLADPIPGAVRRHYASVVSCRAMTREQSRFEQAALILFRRAQKERFTQAAFEDALYDLIAEYCRRLLIAGYADGGIEDHELTDRDEGWLAGHLAEQRQRVSDVATKIYVDGVVTDDEITGKPRMWWNLSAHPAYNEGLARAAKNALGRFWGKNGDEQCRDCTQLYGRAYPISVWFNYFDRQLPPCNSTECGGYNCEHFVELYFGKQTPGRPPPLVGPRRTLEFEAGAFDALEEVTTS